MREEIRDVYNQIKKLEKKEKGLSDCLKTFTEFNATPLKKATLALLGSIRKDLDKANKTMADKKSAYKKVWADQHKDDVDLIMRLYNDDIYYGIT